MKTSRFYPVLWLVLMTYIVGCGTASVSMSVLQPAQINVPQSIKSLAAVNRSLPAKDERVNNVVEGIITGEGLFVDRDGSRRCVEGIANGLMSSPRFTIVIPGNMELKGTGTAEWPAPLDWAEVERICKENNVDALLALETFDHNVARNMGKENKTRTENGQTISYIEFTAFMNISVSAGWRIYDPKTKQIIDQNTFLDQMGWNGKGVNENEAVSKLPAERGATMDAGFFAGQQYASRISPLWVNVSRMYYRKANDDFKVATRKAEISQWKEASDIWIKYVNDPDPKVAGRACFNMALYREIEGDLDGALDWAKKSYSNYGNKKGRYYSNILSNRIADQARLKEQMEGK